MQFDLKGHNATLVVVPSEHTHPLYTPSQSPIVYNEFGAVHDAPAVPYVKVKKGFAYRLDLTKSRT